MAGGIQDSAFSRNTAPYTFRLDERRKTKDERRKTEDGSLHLLLPSFVHATRRLCAVALGRCVQSVICNLWNRSTVRTVIIRMKQFFLIIELLLALSGCAAVPAIPAAQAASYPTASAVATQPAQPAITALRYQRSGGISGRTTGYIIHADGSIEREASALLRASTVQAANPSAATQLFAQIAAAMNSVTPGDYAATTTCCDRAAITLTITLDDKAYTYSTIDAAPNEPQSLRVMLELVQGYLSGV